MSEQTFGARGPFQDSRGAQSSLRGRRETASKLIYSNRWLVGAAALVLVSAGIVVWARARPGYDPYGWLVWGHLTIHGALDTNGAPSWKPLPFVFTVPYALFGRYELWLWMVTAVALSLGGLVFAWRVAFALVDAPPERRYAAYAAGLVAALALFGIDVYLHSVLSAESDTVVVTLCLAAVDCILHRRYRWAFWAWWLAALGRPEVWAPMALYVLWAWRTIPEMRRQMTAGIGLLPLLWFGIPALSSKSPFSAASLAQHSPRELHGNKITGTFGRFLALNGISIKLAALIATASAVLRRDRAVLMLAAGALLWVVVETAFALHGWPAVPRYMFEAAAAVCVLAGVFVGRVILDAGSILARARVSVSPQAAGWVSAMVIAIFAVSLVPTAHSRLDFERKDLRSQRARTTEIGLLSRAVTQLGGSRILACGQPNIPIAWQSILAWYLGTNTGVLYFSAKHEREHPRPLLNIYPHSYGWQVFPSHDQTVAQAARCHRLTFRT
ncbi:MAG: hypothetical protein ACR2MK_00240 [Solirubrobacteraceae bacterium]